MAACLMQSCLPFSGNRLAYPAGRAPGIDPSHPAAQNCGFSGISAYGGEFIDILSSRVGTLFGGSAPVASLFSSLGPITLFEGDLDNCQFPFTSPASTNITLAAIGKLSNLTSESAQYFLNTSAPGTGTGLGFNLGDSGNFCVFAGAGTSFNLGVPGVFEKPYFFAASFFNPGGGNILYSYVIRRLDTGECFSGTVQTSDGLINVGDGSIWVGNRGANDRELNGGMAAGTASLTYMSESQLRAWADDPWSFWYPRPTDRLISITATAVTYTAFSIPQHSLSQVVRRMVGY